MKKMILALALLAAPLAASQAEEAAADRESVRIYRKGFEDTLAWGRARKVVIKDVKMLTLEQKGNLRQRWKRWMDYQLALDSIGAKWKGFAKFGVKKARKEGFLTSYMCYLTQYRYALEAIHEIDAAPGADTILNEPIEELGIPGNSYAAYKFRYLNVARGAEFAAFEAVYNGWLGKGDAASAAEIEEDRAAIWTHGAGKGEAMALKNAWTVVADTSLAAWLPVQQGVSEFMGHTKFKRKGRTLISSGQVAELKKRLEPGDMVLARKEWYLSNVGLPGFWPHAALYAGTSAERQAYFADGKVLAWCRSKGAEDLESLLKKDYPDKVAAYNSPAEGGHERRVIEAIGEGVSLSSLEHTAGADSLAAMRPRLSKLEKAKAIHRAFYFQGRPYDFNFDFESDAALVCSELVYKCYEAEKGGRGLKFPLEVVLGRKVTAPNLIARQFAEEHGTPLQQSDLVVFLDGNEKAAKSLESTVEEFKLTWKRPKWHIFVQQAAKI